MMSNQPFETKRPYYRKTGRINLFRHLLPFLIATVCCCSSGRALAQGTLRQVRPADFDSVKQKVPGFWYTYKNRRIGLVNSRYQELMAPGLVGIYPRLNLGQFIAVVRSEKNIDSYGVLDTLGHWVIAPEYWDIQGLVNAKASLRDGRYPVYWCRMHDKSWRGVDIRGQTVQEDIYYDYISFSGGWGSLGNDYDPFKRKRAVVNPWGQIITPFKYESVSGMSEGRIRVQVNKGAYSPYGFVDASGREVIEPVYARADNFFEKGVAVVSHNALFYGAIDVNGNKIIPFDYRELSHDDGVFRAMETDKWGLLDAKGKIIIPFEYDAIMFFISGFSIVKKDEKFGMINTAGNWVLPLDYDGIAYTGMYTPRKNTIAVAHKGEAVYWLDEAGKLTPATKAELKETFSGN